MTNMAAKHPNVRNGCRKYFSLLLTDEQIEKYANTHPVLKRDFAEDVFDTIDRDLLIDAIVISVVGKAYHWPLNGDTVEYSNKFFSKFFLKAKTKGIRITKRAEKLFISGCAECGRAKEAGNHIRYGADLHNPVKHEFVPWAV
jgi:hypothetical protein